MTRLPTRVLAVALAATAVLACSGDDDTDDAAPSSTAVTETTDGGTIPDTTLPPPPVDPTGTGLVCEVVGEPVAVADDTLDIVTVNDEFVVTETDDTTVPGSVHVQFQNQDDVPHDLWLAPLPGVDALPRNADGTVDTDAAGALEPLGPIGGGDSCEGTYTLEAGTYVVFSTLVDDEGTPYVDLGMATSFDVAG